MIVIFRADVTDLDDGRTETVLVADRVHVLFQVHIQELKHQVQLGVGMNDIEQPIHQFDSSPWTDMRLT